MEWIKKAINNLLIDGEGRVFSRIQILDKERLINGTESKCYSYCLKLDRQGHPRTNDLIDYVATKIVDYSIPKKLQDNAREHLIKTGSTSKIIELENRAKALFVDLDKTGEFGEMLLYILVQEILELPQLISKMTLKTSGKLHYQGADGIHVKYEDESDSLSLYWGESKMEKTPYAAIKHCFESLKGFLTDPMGAGSTQERDLQLITSNIAENLNNSKLESLLVRYFDLDDDLSNKLNYKGVCFVGFDSDSYPSSLFESTNDELVKNLLTEIDDWLKLSSNQIKRHQYLEKFEIHVFMIPFPSVQEFRDRFLELVKV